MAALCVVAYHLQYGIDAHLAFEDATTFFRRGYLFVDLFFILSGFIISYVNRGDRTATVPAAEYRDFLGRRLIRLYPLLLFTLAFMLAFSIAFSLFCHLTHKPDAIDWSPTSLIVLLSQVLMLNAWTTLPPGWNIPTWSISAELFAYLMFPLLVGLHALRPRLALALLAVVAIAFYAVVGTGLASLDILGFPAPFRCLAGFALGMLIYYARAWIAALPVPLLAAAQIVAVAATILCLTIACNDVLIVPAFAVLVATTWTDAGPLPWLIVRRPLLYLGDISYSVYLTHVPVIEALHPFWLQVAKRLPASPAVDRIGWLALCYAGVLLLSHFTYRRIEIPARRNLNRRLLGHPARAIAQSSPAP